MWCFSTTFSAADKYANFREDFLNIFMTSAVGHFLNGGVIR
jgi:hypothetical protein